MKHRQISYVAATVLLAMCMETNARFVQPDPTGTDSGLNRFEYAQSNSLNYIDPLGLYTEVVVWKATGLGSSSMGHVSTNVNGQHFSWSPGGWDKKFPTVASYNAYQQTFRGGTGVTLSLSPQQEVQLAACMRAHSGPYGAISNNCGNPIQKCLDAVGAGIGQAVLPRVILDNLQASPNANGSVTYPSPVPTPDFGGGLLWR